MNNKKFIITIIILAVIVAAVSFFAVNEARKNKEMSQLFAVEKQEMENEYSTFATQYDELQIQINNDSLREKLESEKLKTQRLLEELRQVKTSDAAEIMRLKKELKTVRAVLRSYVMQIDSLNKINAALMQENQEVKSKYSAATAQISNLSQETKSLNEKVSLAAQLDATNIRVQTLNKRGRDTERVKNIKKIAISFTIVKNITAQTGNKTLYVRIAKPDNEVLTKSPSNQFKFEDRNISYSIKKYIEYTGEEQTVTVYWDVYIRRRQHDWSGFIPHEIIFRKHEKAHQSPDIRLACTNGPAIFLRRRPLGRILCPDCHQDMDLRGDAGKLSFL